MGHGTIDSADNSEARVYKSDGSAVEAGFTEVTASLQSIPASQLSGGLATMSKDDCAWIKPIFHSPAPATAWQSLFEMLGTLSQASTSPEELRKQTIAPDRLLAESAWDLWQEYDSTAPRTSQAIQEWWAKSSATGRATLILDALSLLQLPLLLGGAEMHKITP